MNESGAARTMGLMNFAVLVAALVTPIVLCPGSLRAETEAERMYRVAAEQTAEVQRRRHEWLEAERAKQDAVRARDEETRLKAEQERQRGQDDIARMYKEIAEARARAEAEWAEHAMRPDVQLAAWSVLACVAAADRKKAAEVIAQERAYAKKAGVVNLALLEEQKQILKAADHEEARALAAVKAAKGKRLACSMEEIGVYAPCRGTRTPIGAAFDEDDESCFHIDNQRVVNIVELVTAQ